MENETWAFLLWDWFDDRIEGLGLVEYFGVVMKVPKGSIGICREVATKKRLRCDLEIWTAPAIFDGDIR